MSLTSWSVRLGLPPLAGIGIDFGSPAWGWRPLVMIWIRKVGSSEFVTPGSLSIGLSTAPMPPSRLAPWHVAQFAPSSVAEPTRLISDRAPRRIAVISMHTSPTASLGQNANGGLNVYVREVCSAFSDRGIATDVFTRVQSRDDPAVESLAPLSRVIYLAAGNGLDKYSLINEAPAFAAQVGAFAEIEGLQYDLLFSHYWLSGEVACLLRPQLAVRS